MDLYIIKLCAKKKPKNYLYHIVDKEQYDKLVNDSRVLVTKVGVLYV